MFRLASVAIATVGIAGFLSAPAEAGFTINLGGNFTEGKEFRNAPGGLSIHFGDLAANIVRITIRNDTINNGDANIGQNVHFQAVLFNLKDAFWKVVGNPNNDNDWSPDGDFNYVDGVQVPTPHFGILHNAQQYQVSHEKNFDFKWGFTGNEQFYSGDFSVYDFTYTGSRTDFDAEAFRDMNAGENPPNYHAAVHYGYDGDSGKSLSDIPINDGGIEPVVPVPASIVGLMIAGAFLLMFRGNLGIV